MNAKLFQKFDETLKECKPELYRALHRGMPEKRIRVKLEKAGIRGDVEPVIELYHWRNGGGDDPGLTPEEAALSPGSIYAFTDFPLMLAHMVGFEEGAEWHPKFKDVVGRYFPIFWDGSDSWMAIDLKPGMNSRIVFIFSEIEDAVSEAYESIDLFLEDAIRALVERDEWACFAPGRRPNITERRCTFCRETQANVDKLIESVHEAAICNKCVALCHDEMRREEADLSIPNKPHIEFYWID